MSERMKGRLCPRWVGGVPWGGGEVARDRRPRREGERGGGGGQECGGKAERDRGVCWQKAYAHARMRVSAGNVLLGNAGRQ